MNIGIIIFGIVVVVAVICACRSGGEEVSQPNSTIPKESEKKPAEPESCLAKGLCTSLLDDSAWSEESSSEDDEIHKSRFFVRAVKHGQTGEVLKVWKNYYGFLDATYHVSFCGREFTPNDREAIHDAVFAQLNRAHDREKAERIKASEPVVQIFEKIGCPESVSKQPAQ